MLAGKVSKDSLVVVVEMVIVLLLAYPLGYRTSGVWLVVDMLLVFLTAVSFFLYPTLWQSSLSRRMLCRPFLMLCCFRLSCYQVSSYL